MDYLTGLTKPENVTTNTQFELVMCRKLWKLVVYCYNYKFNNNITKLIQQLHYINGS